MGEKGEVAEGPGELGAGPDSAAVTVTLGSTCPGDSAVFCASRRLGLG